jgi:hypothetical protein
MIKMDANEIAKRHGLDALRDHIDKAKVFTPAAASGGETRKNSEDVEIEIASLPPLTLDEWRARDLPDPDFIMGYWLTTTTRALMTAATGLGKTNFGLALGMRVAAGVKFLHWQARRPCRVLYIDGEMSARLLRSRILDEEKRVSVSPEHFFALSHEDLKLRPLNTPEGQAWLKAFIKKIGGVDLIVFDNIMCLTLGDQKDPEVWQKTLPLALALTGAGIGQLWIHHTGHDESRSYGDKSREWQMDTVAHLDAVKRDDTDVSFTLTFKGKARERTPATGTISRTSRSPLSTTSGSTRRPRPVVRTRSARVAKRPWRRCRTSLAAIRPSPRCPAVDAPPIATTGRRNAPCSA